MYVYITGGEPLGAMETGADYPSPANNHEDPYRNSDLLAAGLVSGGSSTLNKRSRRRRYSFFAHPWINPVDPRNTSSVPVTAGVLRDHPCSRGDHSLSDDMDGKNKCSTRNLADRFPQDYSFLQSKGNQTGNVLPSDVRE